MVTGKGCSFLAAVPSDSNGQQTDEAGLNYNNWASGSGRQAEIGDDTSYKKQPAQNIKQVKCLEFMRLTHDFSNQKMGTPNNNCAFSWITFYQQEKV